MSYKIVPSLRFLKNAKSLAKKYASIKADLIKIEQLLLENPLQGTPIGKDCYKIRMAIASKGRGKSGGSRLITCVKIVHETVYFLTIYDKAEQESLDDKILKELLKEIDL